MNAVFREARWGSITRCDGSTRSIVTGWYDPATGEEGEHTTAEIVRLNRLKLVDCDTGEVLLDWRDLSPTVPTTGGPGSRE